MCGGGRERLSFRGLGGLRRDVMEVSDVRPEVYLFGENASCTGLGHTSPPCDSPRSCKLAQSVLHVSAGSMRAVVLQDNIAT